MKVVVGKRFAYHAVLLKFHAHLAKAFDFGIYNRVGETKFGNTVFQHAANFVKSLINGDIVALFSHIACERQSARTATDNSHLNAVGRVALRLCSEAVEANIVAGEAFEIADSHRLMFHFEVNTLAFALFFLRANAAAHSRQSTCLLERGSGIFEVTAFDVLDKLRDVDSHRATGDALRVRAVEAALSLEQSHLGSDALIDLLVASDAIVGGEFRHLYALNGSALLGRHAFAKLFAPFLLARCGIYIVVFHIILGILF